MLILHKRFFSNAIFHCGVMVSVFISVWVMAGNAIAMSKPPTLSDQLKISSPTLSSDGRVVVFSYQFANKYPRLGIYQVDTGELAPLDLPEDLVWQSPTVSPDGRYLAAGTYCSKDCPSGGKFWQIALLDLSSPEVNYKFLTKGERYRESPMFSPDGTHLVFNTGSTYISSVDNTRHFTDYGLSMVSVLGGEETELAPSAHSKDSFYSLGSPYFLSKDKIALSAIPFDSDGPVSVQTKKLGKGTADPVGLTLNLRNEGAGYALMPENKTHTVSNLSASDHGDVVFIDFNEDGAEPEGYSYQYELFMSRKGIVTQLTHIKSFLHAPFISRDGLHVAFLEDKNRGTSWNVMLYDVGSGQVSSTGIREKILENLKGELIK